MKRLRFFHRQHKRLTTKQKLSYLLLFLVLIFLFVVAWLMGPLRAFFWDTPYLAGMLGPQKYLILLHNNSELRPAGGFITAYGTVSMTFGVPSVEFYDVYTIQNDQRINAPYPFDELFSDDPFYAGWQLRDANFSPDFATSAQKVLDFYNMRFPDQKFTGVIGLDFNVAEDFLRLLGGITVEGEEFTANNFFQKLQRDSKNIDVHDEKALAGRKDILSQLAQTTIKKLIYSPFSWRHIARILDANVREKHFMTYFTGSGLQKKFTLRNWTGSVGAPQPSHDYLHVNVANVGGRKADRYVQKHYEYTVTFPYEGSAHARLVASFAHQGDYNIQSDIYTAYVRAYVPNDSKLTRVDANSFDDLQTGSELGLNYFGHVIRMNPGERREIIYEYDLPETIFARDYVLELVKQAGVVGDSYNVTVRMPNDHGVTYAGSSVPLTVRENVAFWTGTLDKDVRIVAQKQPDTYSPIVLWQNFRNLRTIEVRFQETIDPQSIMDMNNFDLIDKNFADKNRDNVRVTGARVENMDLLIDVDGVSLTPGERYTLVMRNIRDLSGNFIEPNPMEVTVVQR